MKEKIKIALKQKYSHTGLGDDVYDGVADLILPTIKEEADIDTKISGCDVLLRGVQSAIDRERTARSEAEKRLKALSEKPKADPKEETKTEPQPQSELEALREMVKSLANQMSELNREKAEQSTLEQLKAILTRENVPESYYRPILSGRTFGDGFDVAAYATEVVNGWKTMASELGAKRFEGVNPPDKGAGKQDEQDELARLIAKGTEEIINNNKTH